MRSACFFRILLGFVERSAMNCGPRRNGTLRKKHADRICQLAVRSHIEDKLYPRSFRIAVQRRAFTHEVILINVALCASVRLQTADGHASIIERLARLCPGPGMHAFSISRRTQLD